MTGQGFVPVATELPPFQNQENWQVNLFLAFQDQNLDRLYPSSYESTPNHQLIHRFLQSRDCHPDKLADTFLSATAVRIFVRYGQLATAIPNTSSQVTLTRILLNHQANKGSQSRELCDPLLALGLCGVLIVRITPPIPPADRSTALASECPRANRREIRPSCDHPVNRGIAHSL